MATLFYMLNNTITHQDKDTDFLNLIVPSLPDNRPVLNSPSNIKYLLEVIQSKVNIKYYAVEQRTRAGSPLVE